MHEFDHDKTAVNTNTVFNAIHSNFDGSVYLHYHIETEMRKRYQNTGYVDFYLWLAAKINSTGYGGIPRW